MVLAKKFRLSKEKDFERVFKKGKRLASRFFLLKYVSNDLGVSRFATVVSAKISKKAVVRNRIRRQISEIIRFNLEKIKKGLDVIVIPNQKLLEQSFQIMEKELKDLLIKANLLFK